MHSDFTHSKMTLCKSCTQPVAYKTNRNVLCSPCREIRHRERSAVSADKRRRAAGVPLSKGVQASCSDCGTSFLKNNHRAIRCAQCQKAFTTQRTRLASALRGSDPGRKAKYNQWLRNRRRYDPKVRISSHMATLIHRALKSGKAGRSWRSFVSFSLEELTIHLERQFQKGMSWDNYGEWHIDHILPLSGFDLSSPDSESFKHAWSLANLRPLWARENMTKNAKRLFLI